MFQRLLEKDVLSEGTWQMEEKVNFSERKEEGESRQAHLLRGNGSRAELCELVLGWESRGLEAVPDGSELGFWELGSPQAPRQH